MAKIRLGCIADDFTGASDAASFLQKNGLKTILYSETPSPQEKPEDCGAVVIALKTRTAPPRQAVDESLAALDWLRARGAEQLYVKYCSTFDSTPQGNIGPVLDAALEKYHLPYTLLCPSLPVNGRTVRDGRLAVNGVPLHKSHMKNHPLTPMWDDRLAELMRGQSRYPVFPLSLEELRQPQQIREKLSSCEKKLRHFYLAPDYYEDSHADEIGAFFGGLPLLSGGSGLLGGAWLRAGEPWQPPAAGGAKGKTLLLAGSCSAVTLRQIEAYRGTGAPLVHMNPLHLLSREQNADRLWEEIGGHSGALVYSSDTPENLRRAQACGRETVAALLEETTAELAQRAVRSGYTQIIVAGGETSGAVTKKLGYRAFCIGPSVAPGVPVMYPLENRRIALVLKSGNFGQEDFFDRARKQVEA